MAPARRVKPLIKTFDTLEQLDVLTSPFRVQLLEYFQEPTPVKTVAEKLGVPVTRIYYHVNLMVEHGFLTCVQERKVGSLVERLFAMTADGFRPSDAFHERYGAQGDLEAAKLVLRSIEAGLEAAVSHGLLDDRNETSSTMSLSQIRLTPERRVEFIERLNDLLEEFDDRTGDPMWRLVAVTPRWVADLG